jgi:beta-glucosidase
MTRPVRELKAFKRVWLEPGATTKVYFSLHPNQIGFYLSENEYVTEPGKFSIFVGGNSNASLETIFELK